MTLLDSGLNWCLVDKREREDEHSCYFLLYYRLLLKLREINFLHFIDRFSMGINHSMNGNIAIMVKVDEKITNL